MPNDEAYTEVEVDNADLDFVDEFAGNLGFLENLNAKSLDKQIQKGPAKANKKSAQDSGSDSDSDDQGPEAAYERAPRQRLQEQQSFQATGLPTKNLLGELVYAKHKSSKPQPASIQVLVNLLNAPQILNQLQVMLQKLHVYYLSPTACQTPDYLLLCLMLASAAALCYDAWLITCQHGATAYMTKTVGMALIYTCSSSWFSCSQVSISASMLLSYEVPRQMYRSYKSYNCTNNVVINIIAM